MTTEKETYATNDQNRKEALALRAIKIVIDERLTAQKTNVQDDRIFLRVLSDFIERKTK